MGDMQTEDRVMKFMAMDSSQSEKTLSYETDKRWLMLLKKNEAEEIEKILEESDSEERERLVNGTFVRNFCAEEKYVTQEPDYEDPGQLLIEHPWCIAAVHGANEVLGVLFRYVD